ncbi:hypothetical protein RYX36_023355 [Vicia faba]
MENKWEKLCDPEPKLHVEIVREFYANALPIMEGETFEFKTWVRGKEISFSINSISEYLGNPLPVADDELCKYHKRLARGNWNIEHVKDKLMLTRQCYEVNVVGKTLKFLWKNMMIIAQVIMVVVLYNIRPHNHPLFILMEIACLS